MGLRARRLKFESAAPDGAIRILSDRVDAQRFAEGNRTVIVNLARVMSFRDPWYGKVELTHKKFNQMIKNFNDDVYGQKIFIDVSHNPSEGAAAEIKKIFMDGQKFRGEVEFTEYGVEAVTKRRMIYLSMDFTEDYLHPETEKKHGALLFGAGLTIRPRVKGLDPVQLSFDDDEKPVNLTPRARRLLSEEINTMWEQYLKQLRTRLSELKLSEGVVLQFAENFETTAKTLGDNEDAIKGVMDGFAAQAKVLSDNGQGASDEIKLDFSSLNIQTGMTEDKVLELMERQKQADESKATQLAEKREANIKIFTDALAEADGLKSLSEDQRKTLGEAADVITADMTADQVKRLADNQIKIGNDMAVSMQLSSMGFETSRGGTVHISVDESNSIKKLSDDIANGLRGTSHHGTGQLLLLAEDKLPPFCRMILSEFDRINAAKLFHESKQFAGGETGIADTSLPAGFQRTVIMEALSDLRVLELVQTLTNFSATATTDIPYETRDTSGVLNDGIVYEGQDIHEASVSQAMDLAYILPMKLAFIITNEVIHFSRASAINWDAYARNVESNARVVRELITRRICNELQRSADAYQATDVVNEGFDGQLGAVSTIKTTNYPIVRPHQQKDLQGNNVGSAENAITVRLNGAAIQAYDGSGTQSAATYYRVTNYNLGYVQFVDETGSPVNPPNTAGADDISYSYATNVAKFDLDNGGTELGLHLNGLLRAFGERKALMAQDRYVVPDFLLMSHTLNNTATNANNFEVDSKRNGSDTTPQGDLDRVKGINAWSTNAPGVDLGDERTIMGQRGTLTYTVAKPFVTGQPVEAVNPTTGKLIGKKKAYGEEYSAIKVPTPIRNRLTSVLAYSFTGR